VVDVHGDRGYVLGSFDEVLRGRGGTTGIRVRGRVVHFWRRLEGRWRIEMLLTGRSAPDEEV
jgi:ketosteroid isomerase-like protein